jgi:hypothetical protein
MLFVRRFALIVVFLAAIVMLAAACASSSKSSSSTAADDDVTPADDDASPDDDDASPADDDTSPSPAEPYCEAGKQLLLTGNGGLSALQFQQGLSIDPDAVNCRYGLTLADTLNQFDTISIIVSYVAAAIKGYQPPTKFDEPQTGQGFFDELVDIIINSAYVDSANEAIAEVEWLRANDPTIVYPLASMPIILNFAQVANPNGNFDLTAAVAAEAWAGSIGGLLAHVPALNLDCELGVIFEIVGFDFHGSFDVVFGNFVNLLLELFDNPLFPDFLTLKDNAAPWKAAGLEAGLGFLHASETFTMMTKESGTPAGTVLGYDDLSGTHQWNPNDPLIVPSWGDLTPSENQVAWAIQGVLQHLAASFLDYTAYDIDHGVPHPFLLSYLNPLLTAFGLPAIIPDWSFLSIDFGKSYYDADPTGLKTKIVTILQILHDLFPGG